MTDLSFSQVRANFASTLQYVQQKQQPVFISQHGKAAAVLISVEQFNKIQPNHDFIESLNTWRAQNIKHLLNDVDDIFDKIRSNEHGRDFEW